jgi:hypothetical protein
MIGLSGVAWGDGSIGTAMLATVSRTLRDLSYRSCSARLERRLPVQNRSSAHRAQEAVVSCNYGGFIPGMRVTPGYVGR